MIVLDTHIWLWWVNANSAALGEKRKELVDAADVAAVSVIPLQRTGRSTALNQIAHSFLFKLKKVECSFQVSALAPCATPLQLNTFQTLKRP